MLIFITKDLLKGHSGNNSQMDQIQHGYINERKIMFD